MQGMKPKESISLILGAISLYGFLTTPIGKEVWMELGIMRGLALMGMLCLTTVAWIVILGIISNIISRLRSSNTSVRKENGS